jgi:TolB-like protein
MKLSIPLAALMMVAWAAGAQEAKPSKALVLPFDSIGPEPKPWIAKALQQNLVAEVSRLRSVEALVGSEAAADQEAALRSARATGARYVIFGAYQVVEADLRMTGQVVDVESKQSLVGLKATGTLRDLFGLEDTIAAQVKRALPQAKVAAAAPAGGGGVEMLEQPKAAAPAPVVAPPGIAPRGPVEIGQAARAMDDLVDEMGHAIERIRYRNTWQDDYYDSRYYRRPYYGYPYYSYPVYYNNPIYVLPGGTPGGIVGKAYPTRYSGTTELGIPRLSFPNFVPDQRGTRR